jgi:hypothetical protein
MEPQQLVDHATVARHKPGGVRIPGQAGDCPVVFEAADDPGVESGPGQPGGRLVSRRSRMAQGVVPAETVPVGDRGGAADQGPGPAQPLAARSAASGLMRRSAGGARCSIYAASTPAACRRPT